MDHAQQPMVEQLYFRLCSDHLSIEAVPRKRVRVDLQRMKENPVSGHDLVMWTPGFAVLRNQRGHEITLRRDGRMIVRKAVSDVAAHECAERLLEIVMEDFAQTKT